MNTSLSNDELEQNNAESGTQSPALPPRKPKHSKRNLLIILIVIVLIGLAGLLFWMMKGNQSKDTAVDLPTTQKDTKPAPAGPAAKCTDTTNRIFADRSVGMAFCYPTEWGDATVHDAKVGPADTGDRESIAFSANPLFSVGGTSDDWSTTIGRGVGCLEPNNATLPLSAYDTSWHGLVGSGASVEFATRSLPALTGGYDSTESVSNILDSGVCTQAHKVITGSRYRVAFAAFVRDFAEASGIVTPRLHMDNPNVLFSVAQRQQFDAVMASLVAY